jgi:hypothetical protein
MNLTKLYAIIQLKPRNKKIYKEIKKYYESIGMKNESEGFNNLIERKFNAERTDTDK